MPAAKMQLCDIVRIHCGLSSLCDVGFGDVFLDGLQAVFVGEVLGPEGFEFLLQTVVRFQQHRYISLQEIKLALQIEPAPQDQGSQ